MTALRKVLVVDDDPVVARSFDRVLSPRGYAVITAQSGQEALNKLSGEDYDVVFTDIRMPGMNGLEVAERVKASQPWLPVVIVTGYGTEANEARAEAAGVSGFLHKPLSPAMIEFSMQNALLKKDAAAEQQAATEAGAAPRPAAAGGHELPAKIGLIAKNVGLFIVSPFIGLAYVLLFPFVGLAVLAWMGVRALVKPSDVE